MVLEERKTYQTGFPAKGKPATKATSIPIQIKSWLIVPSAPRISVGEIYNIEYINISILQWYVMNATDTSFPVI